MNFDNLKDAWANDKTAGSHLPFEHVPTGKTTSAIGLIRRNMKKELIVLAAAFILLIFLLLGAQKNTLSVLLVSMAMFLLLMQTVYYFFRFYLFYRSIGRYDLSIRKSIYKIIYELEINIEIYKTFNYCALPLILLIIIGGSMDLTAHNSLLVIFIALGVAQLIAIFIIHLHIRLWYGRHLDDLKKIMDDLETEEVATHNQDQL